MSIHVIHFSTSITPISAGALRNTCLQALQQGASDIRINFSCEGGSNLHGFALYNFLRSLPVPLTMHNTGNVESMGLVVFLAASRRFANLHSRFLIHPMHWGFEQGRVDSPRLAEYSARLNDDLERYAQIFDEATQGAKEPLSIRPHLSGSHHILNAHTASACGIVHEVAESTLPSDSVKWWVDAHG